MSLRLYSHPFASFCQKVLIALYENATPFEAVLIDLGDEADRAELMRVWRIAKFPVLLDDARNCSVPESSIIIEYLNQYYPGPVTLLPRDPDLARETRLLDRFYDLYVSEPMQKIVGNRLRPAEKRDAFGVEQAKASLLTAYAMIEAQIADKPWATGDSFSLADCSAAPALLYANVVYPIGDAYPRAAAYLKRLRERPSFARVLREAEPFWAIFPKES
ncbi:MAG TPA: glutathione S-transferase family protein [Polyangiaceae bacterium]|jgi:glutathione S-transferase